MDAERKFLYWRDIAEYDLDTADAMYNTGRWLYVAFMCQQSIEKLCKGLYVLYVDDNVPRSHKINYLLHHFVDKLPANIGEGRKNLFDKLTAYYMNGRYPEYKEAISDLVDKETARYLLLETREAFQWLLAQKI